MRRFFAKIRSEKGSVLMEFCLMLPILLLLFGGTFLMLDVNMGRLHLQEANRNLAWLENDRYNNGEKLIQQALYSNVKSFYDERNDLERKWDAASSFWVYGKKNEDNEAPEWAHIVEDYKDENAEIKLNYAWAQSINIANAILDNDFMTIHSGNMPLRMGKVSGAYIGALAAADIIYPRDEGRLPFYQSAYLFTRATDEKGEPLDVNGESIVLHRSGEDRRDDIHSPNNLLLQNTLYRCWPSNGTLGDIRVFLGIF